MRPFFYSTDFTSTIHFQVCGGNANDDLKDYGIILSPEIRQDNNLPFLSTRT